MTLRDRLKAWFFEDSTIETLERGAIIMSEFPDYGKHQNWLTVDWTEAWDAMVDDEEAIKDTEETA